MDDDRSELNALRSFAESTLGSGIRVEDCSRAFGRKSITWKVTAADGSRFYLKRHEFRHHFAAEVRALNDWVSHLEPGSWWATPEVVATSDDLGAVVLTELPGEVIEDVPPGADDLRAAYRHAGRLVRYLHDSDIDLSGEQRVQNYSPEEIARHLEMSQGHIDARTCEWAESILTRPDAWDGLKIVPMHGDYSPRNWIVESGDPTLKVIDWERSRPGYWVEDFQRMSQDHWLDAPKLGDAFFEGYGRTPTKAEWRHSNQITLAIAIGGVGWSISHGDTWFEQHNRKTIDRLKDIL